MGALTAVDPKEGQEGAPPEARHERLGGARAEFVANLGRRAADLRAALAQIEAEPGQAELREELWRRLHALGAAARLLRFAKLADRVGEAQLLLEAASDRAELSAEEVSTLRGMLEDLPALAWGQAAAGEIRPRPAANRNAESAPAAAPATERSADGAAEGVDPLTALVVGGGPLAEALAEDAAGFEVERTEDPTCAIDLARAVAPDVIVLDVDLEGARTLAEVLAGDPLTEAVPIIAVGRFARADEAAPYLALGVARALPRPVSPDTLRRAAAEAAATYVRGEAVRSPLGEVTLDQLGARLAEELRRGLCDAAEARGRGSRVDLGEGAEVLAALWGAVARIRDLVTIRSQGAVRFAPRGPEGALPLAPWLGPDVTTAGGRARAARPGLAAEPSLDGLAAVVADDDPAVTWFLAGVLRAAGAAVHEAHDGARALDLAYQVSPDLVISDVLMPHLDGFALCRALKRDVVLRDVPVILLSWKEDLLQRLRELGADADGYLRKEASAAAIVQRACEVLRPRQRVAERIAAGGEVRGRLDGLTTRTLLALACARRPDSSLTVRDAAFLYEVQIHGGRPVSATRTAPDGTFQRGPGVLAAMLGVGSGRFVISPPAPADAHVSSRGDLEGPLGAQLLPAIAAARAGQRLLSGPALLAVERVEIDEHRMSSYLDATPEPARSLLRRLCAGASPRALIAGGYAPAWLVEDVLCDAAAHGSVVRVIDRRFEDLLEAAAAREADVLRGARRSPAAVITQGEEAPPPMPTPLEQALADLEHGAPLSGEAIEALADSERAPQRVTRPWTATPGPVMAVIEGAPEEAVVEEAPVHRPTLVGLPQGQEAASNATPVSPVAEPPVRLPAAVSVTVAAAAPVAAAVPAAAAVPVVAAAPIVGRVPAAAPVAARVPAAAPVAARAPAAAPAPLLTLGSLTPPPVVEVPAPPAPRAAARPVAPPVDETPAPSPTPRRVRRPSSFAPTAAAAPAAPPRENRATMWVLLAVAAFVFAVGARLSRERDLQASPVPPEPAPAPAPVEPAAEAAPAAPAEPPAPLGESEANPILPEDMPLPADQTVPAGQGLIEVVAGPNDEVLIDGRLVGKGTVRATLEPKATGAYEIRARLRGEERVRFAQVKAGRMTRLRVAPPWRR